MGGQHQIPLTLHHFTCVQVKVITMGTISRQFVDISPNRLDAYQEPKFGFGFPLVMK